MDTSIGVLVGVALVMGSLWAQRRAQQGGAHASAYRRLKLGLALGGLAVAVLTVWVAMEDHRRVREPQPAGVQPGRP